MPGIVNFVVNKIFATILWEVLDFCLLRSSHSSPTTSRFIGAEFDLVPLSLCTAPSNQSIISFI